MKTVLAPVPAAMSPGRSRTIQELTGTISATRLQAWQQCRLKFYFRHVLGLPGSITPARHVGSVVHAVLQAWNLARWKRQPTAPEHFRKVLDLHWKKLQAGIVIDWEESEENERQSSWRLLQAYFEQTPIPANERPEAVEVSVEAELPGLPKLIGFIDLVRAGGRIVDFKTTGKTPDADKAGHFNETQLCCYALLYRDATGQKESAVELHHLVKTKSPKLVVTALEPMTERQKTRLLRMIDSYVEGVTRKDFVPSPGFQCAGCEYFNECRNWCGKEGDGTGL